MRKPAHARPERLLPTTRAQVTGHRFMRRRVEHGLVFGDIRMIHDPLATRRRAMILGVVAVALGVAAAALFAWLKPAPNPGDALIWRDAAGNLYVRVDDTVHPVSNLASARLVAGTAEEPARVGQEHLVGAPRGVPIGIGDAPSAFAAAETPDLTWAVCERAGEVTVLAVEAAAAPRAFAPDTAVLASVGGKEWVVTAEGRTLLPASDSPQGRVVRRRLGIDAGTPRWQPPAGVLGALREHPPVALPDPLPEVLTAGEESWLLTADGGVQNVSPTQRDILADAGASVREVERDDVAGYPDAAPAVDLRLPETAPRWADPAAGAVCVDESRGAAGGEGVDAAGRTPLSGGAVATHFAGLPAGSVAVDTGHGYHVVSLHGLRHEADSAATLEVLGAAHVETVPWEILSLLPEGSPLSRAAALTATY
ncbi:type VII secretion protein EccB [Corynebacterium timonense]|uniref:Type VII secretion protein EccB n=1 Tax=Corynebacterium timonense TaxID=441500 RepID=A0A1H1SL37_9CORY|nr:type VII secretion protein EccB [Corynebacterium timonense]SDS48446.1 type VII secretion protein EccB [Corynebacterium timonense]